VLLLLLLLLLGDEGGGELGGSVGMQEKNVKKKLPTME
jgi:hypothetical protein